MLTLGLTPGQWAPPAFLFGFAGVVYLLGGEVRLGGMLVVVAALAAYTGSRAQLKLDESGVHYRARGGLMRHAPWNEVEAVGEHRGLLGSRTPRLTLLGGTQVTLIAPRTGGLGVGDRFYAIKLGRIRDFAAEHGVLPEGAAQPARPILPDGAPPT